MKTLVLIVISISFTLVSCLKNSDDSNSKNAIRAIASTLPDGSVTTIASPKLSITGQLKGKDGTPISNATMTLSSSGISTGLSVLAQTSSGSAETTTVKTDSTGNYTLVLEVGNFKVTVTSSSGESLGEITFKVTSVTQKPATEVTSETISPDSLVSEILQISSDLTDKPTGFTLSSTDTDPKQLGGTITIKKAASESNITSYKMYWAKLNVNGVQYDRLGEIADFNKTGNDIIYIMANDTAIPSNVTHLLIVSKNSRGEMLDGLVIDISQE